MAGGEGSLLFRFPGRAEDDRRVPRREPPGDLGRHPDAIEHQPPTSRGRDDRAIPRNPGPRNPDAVDVETSSARMVGTETLGPQT